MVGIVKSPRGVPPHANDEQTILLLAAKQQMKAAKSSNFDLLVDVGHMHARACIHTEARDPG
eukprot:scaffold65387_cov20-Tisochrysis_lutea.AAC.3